MEAMHAIAERQLAMWRSAIENMDVSSLFS